MTTYLIPDYKSKINSDLTNLEPKKIQLKFLLDKALLPQKNWSILKNRSYQDPVLKCFPKKKLTQKKQIYFLI